MKTFERKIGKNKGAARLWIEGPALAGWIAKGDRFNIIHHPRHTVIFKAVDGKRKVSGKGDKPIIDICGAALGHLASYKRVTIVATPTKLTIKEKV